MFDICFWVQSNNKGAPLLGTPLDKVQIIFIYYQNGKSTTPVSTIIRAKSSPLIKRTSF